MKILILDIGTMWALSVKFIPETMRDRGNMSTYPASSKHNQFKAKNTSK
jgi:hypothetical protein